MEHLGQAELLLTSFETESDLRRGLQEIAVWARDLKATTYLLQNGPAAENNVQLRELLEDLEFILAQIAQYTGNGHAVEERDLILDGLHERSVLDRVRSAVSSGPVTGLTQGVL